MMNVTINLAFLLEDMYKEKLLVQQNGMLPEEKWKRGGEETEICCDCIKKKTKTLPNLPAVSVKALKSALPLYPCFQ